MGNPIAIAARIGRMDSSSSASRTLPRQSLAGRVCTGKIFRAGRTVRYRRHPASRNIGHLILIGIIGSNFRMDFFQAETGK
jgi:hypothetical protein